MVTYFPRSLTLTRSVPPPFLSFSRNRFIRNRNRFFSSASTAGSSNCFFIWIISGWLLMVSCCRSKTVFTGGGGSAKGLFKSTFSGLISVWMIPQSWRKASPESICGRWGDRQLHRG